MRDRWILFFSGFTESIAEPTGIERIWSLLRRQSTAYNCIHTPLPWNTDCRDLARFIVRNSSMHASVMLVGYSWGGGVACMDLARWLQRMNARLRHEGSLGCKSQVQQVGVEMVCLADPVFRSRILPKWLPLNIATLLCRWPVRVPGNVKRVAWVRQESDWPRATGLKAESEGTTIEPEHVVSERHGRVDDSGVFQQLVLRNAMEFLGKRDLCDHHDAAERAIITESEVHHA